MTTQDLTNNREEIIEIITEKVGAEAVKEVMTAMVKTLGWNDIRSNNAIDYTYEIIDLFDFETKYAMRRGYNAQARLEVINAEASKNLMRHI